MYLKISSAKRPFWPGGGGGGGGLSTFQMYTARLRWQGVYSVTKLVQHRCTDMSCWHGVVCWYSLSEKQEYIKQINSWYAATSRAILTAIWTISCNQRKCITNQGDFEKMVTDLRVSMHANGLVTGFPMLYHWGWVTHICVIQIIIIGSDNGLSLGRHQTIIRTNAGILLIGPLGTNFSENSIEISAFSFKNMHFKMSFAKWCLFRLGLDGLSVGASADILQV